MAVTKEILTLAVETGDALLRNGAEVYRVEDTVLHILKAFLQIHGTYPIAFRCSTWLISKLSKY